MPPEGPTGVFDVRFQSGKIIEHVPANDTTVDLPIRMKDIAYPITFKWNYHAANAVTYNLILNGHVKGNGIGGRISLSNTGSVILQKRGNGGNLVLQPIAIDPFHEYQKTARRQLNEGQLIPASSYLK